MPDNSHDRSDPTCGLPSAARSLLRQLPTGTPGPAQVVALPAGAARLEWRVGGRALAIEFLAPAGLARYLKRWEQKGVVGGVEEEGYYPAADTQPSLTLVGWVLRG